MKRIKTPSPDDMRVAAEWLNVYDTEPEREACERVRDWLRHRADVAEIRAWEKGRGKA